MVISAFLDPTNLEFLQGFEDLLLSRNDSMINTAQALGAIFAYCVLAVQGYGMLTGERQWSIVPMLRPFAFAFVIMFWGTFVNMIKTPTDMIEASSRSNFDGLITDVQALSTQRNELLNDIVLKYAEIQAEIDNQESGDGISVETVVGTIGIDLSDIKKEINIFRYMLGLKLKMLLNSLFEDMALAFFEFAVYFVLFIKTILLYIMVILGPLAFAFSIVPAWGSAWAHWISRFISISLYGTIAWIILFGALGFIEYSLSNEIDRLTIILNDTSNHFAMREMISIAGDDTNMYIVTMLVGGISMLSIPVFATWMIPTAGAVSAVSKAVGSATGVASGGAGSVVAIQRSVSNR